MFSSHTKTIMWYLFKNIVMKDDYNLLESNYDTHLTHPLDLETFQTLSNFAELSHYWQQKGKEF